jgi:hypothetical protein
VVLGRAGTLPAVVLVGQAGVILPVVASSLAGAGGNLQAVASSPAGAKVGARRYRPTARNPRVNGP